MVAYNFQTSFAAAIEAGTKESTIRPNGKRAHAVAGDELQLYTGMRTPNCRLLLRAPCIGSHAIEIHCDGVYLDGLRQVDELGDQRLALVEGFQSFGNMQAWFDRRYGLPCLGFTQILWSWKDRILVPEPVMAEGWEE